MVAERRELGSLPKPPDWWSPEAREQRRANLGVDQQPGGAKVTWAGPRSDAEPTTHLPTLTPGVDRLPQHCGSCQGALLDPREALGDEQRGTLTCTTCGRQVAWLAPRINVTRHLTTNVPETPSRPGDATAQAPRRVGLVVLSVFERLDGCGPACGFRTGHHPAAHEEHGRKTAFAEILDRPTGVVRTGPLTIDFDTQRVTVGDRQAAVTSTELRILGALAARLGTVCSQRELLEQVWGAAAVETRGSWKHGAFHAARVHLARLRHKLGDAAALVETRFGEGVILRREPPIGGEREQRPTTRPRLRRFRLRDRLAAGPGRTVRLVVVGRRTRVDLAQGHGKGEAS